MCQQLKSSRRIQKEIVEKGDACQDREQHDQVKKKRKRREDNVYDRYLGRGLSWGWVLASRMLNNMVSCRMTRKKEKIVKKLSDLGKCR